jgi:hypothetical protein
MWFVGSTIIGYLWLAELLEHGNYIVFTISLIVYILFMGFNIYSIYIFIKLCVGIFKDICMIATDLYKWSKSYFKSKIK